MKSGSHKEGNSQVGGGRKSGERKGAEWVTHKVWTPLINVALATTEKGFKRELKHLGLSKDSARFPAGRFVGNVTELISAQGARCAIVSLQPRGKRSKADTVATIVHEAVHVWQYMRDFIGEDKPSSEFEAYSVQGIVTALLDSYHRQTGERLC